MKNVLKRSLLIAVVSCLPLTAACSGEEKEQVAAQDKAPAETVEAPPGGESAPGKENNAAAVKPVPAEELSRYKALAVCLRGAGVNMSEPEVGKPWDSAPMDAISMTPPWHNALKACPDWEKLVIGIG